MIASAPKFVFFDLGRVLLQYDFSLAARRISEKTGLDGSAVMEATLASPTPICEAIETGKMTSKELYDWTCETFGMTLSQEEFERSHADIFTPMLDSWKLVRDFKDAGFRTGILSNICEVHWNFCAGAFPQLFELFELPLSSAMLGARKPSPEIYLSAAERAGVKPEEILFFDDREENVAGAQAVGMDAILFTTADAAREELKKRGIVFESEE